MALVIDASVAIKWFVREEDSEIASRILEADLLLHAPRLLAAECGNGLWKNCRRKTIGHKQASEALANLERSINVWSQTEPFLAAALQLAVGLDHPVYDMVYLALARELGVRMVTADRRLINRLAGTEFHGLAVPLADWRPT